MNAIVLLAVLAQSNITSPPLLISAVEAQPERVAPRVRTVAAGVLVGSWAVSIANTSAFWIARSENNFFDASGAVIGVMVSTIPLLGPAIGILADMALGDSPDDPFWGGRIAINALSFTAQLGGLIFLCIADRFDAPAMKGFTLVPGKDSVTLGYSGSF